MFTYRCAELRMIRFDFFTQVYYSYTLRAQRAVLRFSHIHGAHPAVPGWVVAFFWSRGVRAVRLDCAVWSLVWSRLASRHARRWHRRIRTRHVKRGASAKTSVRLARTASVDSDFHIHKTLIWRKSNVCCTRPLRCRGHLLSKPSSPPHPSKSPLSPPHAPSCPRWDAARRHGS